MRLLAILVALIPTTAFAVLIPAPKAPYVVTWESKELVDQSRVDPFNSSHARRLMVSRFSPVSPCRCKKICHLPYMPSKIASFEDISLQSQLAKYGPIIWPFGMLAKLQMEVCCENEDKPIHTPRAQTLLLDPGWNTTRLFYSALAQQLASIGYDIIVMDHPYETDIVQFPDGQIIYGGHISDANNTAMDFGLNVRNQDAAFVLDNFDIPQTVYIGHSYGGSAAANALLHDPRIVSAVNLDGLFEMPVRENGVPRALLDFRHDNSTYAAYDATFFAFFDAMTEKHSNVWAKALSIKDAIHGSYSDFSLIGDAFGLRNDKSLQLVVGKATGKRVMEILRAYVGAFIRFTLMHDNEGLLSGPSEKFPDVCFIKS